MNKCLDGTALHRLDARCTGTDAPFGRSPIRQMRKYLSVMNGSKAGLRSTTWAVSGFTNTRNARRGCVSQRALDVADHPRHEGLAKREVEEEHGLLAGRLVAQRIQLHQVDVAALLPPAIPADVATAMAWSSGAISTPTIRRNGNSEATRTARPMPEPRSTNVYPSTGAQSGYGLAECLRRDSLVLDGVARQSKLGDRDHAPRPDPMTDVVEDVPCLGDQELQRFPDHGRHCTASGR